MNIRLRSFEILEIKETFIGKIYVKDDNHPDGGSEQQVEYYFDKPKAIVDIILNSEEELHVGGGYTANDGTTYLAVEKHILRNQNQVIDKFKCPDELVMTSSVCSEGVS